uniref:Small ribosomal subunit protein bS20c n=1 Tax=Flintiella sanguinaria TaxID=101926 RepID=A0A1X9PUK2_9RHOD|nr:30S ribosomal protein S20 [Flintiella sanguinaria]
MNKNKSVLKRIKTNDRNRLYNKAYKSAIKTLIKRFVIALKDADSKSETTIILLNNLMSLAYKKIDKAVKRKVLHSNNGARKKAMLARLLKNKIIEK